ncbi:unnamed protein product, partial [Mesorhabditis spiculigera]
MICRYNGTGMYPHCIPYDVLDSDGHIYTAFRQRSPPFASFLTEEENLRIGWTPEANDSNLYRYPKCIKGKLPNEQAAIVAQDRFLNCRTNPFSLRDPSVFVSPKLQGGDSDPETFTRLPDEEGPSAWWAVLVIGVSQEFSKYMAAWGDIHTGVDAIERGRKFAGMIDTILNTGEPIGNLVLKSVKTTLEPDSPEVQLGKELAVWMKERDQKMATIAHRTGFVWDDQTVYDWNSAIRNRFIPVETMFKLRFLLPEPADDQQYVLSACRRWDYFEKLRVIRRYFVDACPMPTLDKVLRTVNALKAFRRIEVKSPKMMPELMQDYHVHKSKYILNLTSDTELINMLRQEKPETIEQLEVIFLYMPDLTLLPIG